MSFSCRANFFVIVWIEFSEQRTLLETYKMQICQIHKITFAVTEPGKDGYQWVLVDQHCT
jgi:hypothetical protein